MEALVTDAFENVFVAMNQDSGPMCQRMKINRLSLNYNKVSVR